MFNLFMSPPCFYEKGEPSTILRFRTFSWKTKLHSYFLTLYPLGRHFEILIVRKLSGPGQHFSWWIIIDWNPFNTCISRKTTKLIKILCLYFFLHDVVTFLLIPNIVWKRYFFGSEIFCTQEYSSKL